MNDIREDLKAFLDGELSADRASEVQAALDGDPSLRQEVELMKALGFEIKRMKHEPAIVGADATMAKLRRKPRAWWLRPEPYFGVGLCVILIAVIFPVYAQSKSSARHNDAAAGEFADTGLATTGTVPANGSFATPGTADPTLQSPASSGKYMGGGGEGGFSGRVREESEGVSGHSKDKSLDAFNVRGGGRGAAITPDVARSPQLLIRTADLHRRVEDVAKAQSETIKLANANGGFLASNSSTGSEGQLPEANITIRVPVKRFDSVCEAIRAMGTNVSDNTNTDDVTAQVADTEARLKVMRAEEESYVTMLRAARKVGELLEIKERLSSVRQEIESLDAQRKALRDQSSYSTINAVFTQKAKVGTPEAPKNWSEDTWANAVNGLTSALRWLGQVVITVFVYSPLWLPVLLIGWWLSRKAKK